MAGHDVENLIQTQMGRGSNWGRIRGDERGLVVPLLTLRLGVADHALDQGGAAAQRALHLVDLLMHRLHG